MKIFTNLFVLFVLFFATVVTLLSSAANFPVITQNYDVARTGSNTQETILTPSVVNSTRFGKLFTIQLDSDVCGQPLYVPSISLPYPRNVLFIYTADNNDNSPSGIWAVDADNSSSPAIWYSKLPKNARFTTNTPGIDLKKGIMYFVSKDSNDQGMNYFHAINIMTGKDMPGSPVAITGSVPGTGAGSRGGRVYFEEAPQNCRPAMLILNGVVYIAFAFNTDQGNYHGWVIGYEYTGNALVQRAIWCDTPNGNPGGGIWQSGKGLVTDGEYIYLSTGNGDFNPDVGSYGMCVLKLAVSKSNGALTVADYFSPAHEHYYSDEDKDLGNCGPLIIPNTKDNLLFIGSTKYGKGYLVNGSDLGHHSSEMNTCLQTLSMTGPYEVGQNPVVWYAGNGVAYIYLWSKDELLQQYRFDYSSLRVNPGTQYKTVQIKSGGSLSVSSSGTNGGILWAIGDNGVINAFDANDITKAELWSSSWNRNNRLGSVGHFQFPVIVNGKLFVGSGDNTLVVYGVLPSEKW